MGKDSAKKRRICIFCETWASGGIESLFAEILPYAAELFEFDVVSPHIGESIFQEKLERIGVTFHELSGSIRSIRNYREFKKLLISRGYDAVHFNLYQAFAFIYVGIAKRANVRARIAHAHSSGLRNTPTRPVKMLVHRISRRFLQSDITARLACSESAAKFLFGNRQAVIIKNGIDVKRFTFSDDIRKATRKQLGIGDSPLILHVGRMSREKNQEFLLGVQKELLSLLPSARLLLVGDGEDRARLEGIAKELGIGRSVLFLGNSGAVEQLMFAADVFIFPSLFEGFGIAVAEAQCAGLPALVSDGVPDNVFLTELITRIPLSLGSAVWAREAAKILKTQKKRVSRDEEIRARGFTAENTMKQIIEFYF